MNIKREGAVGNFSSEKWAVGKKRLGTYDLTETKSIFRCSFSKFSPKIKSKKCLHFEPELTHDTESAPNNFDVHDCQ